MKSKEESKQDTVGKQFYEATDMTITIMKTQEKIEQLAEQYTQDGIYLSDSEKQQTEIAYMIGYKQCQEDMIKEIDNLKGQLRTYEDKEPKYAVEGDYCAVCGCTEFWNDEEE